MKPLKSPKHMDRVRELPCRICYSDQVEPHHIRDTNITGMGWKASDFLTFPLCRSCHTHLHSGVKAWERAHGEQIWHVTETLGSLYG